MSLLKLVFWLSLILIICVYAAGQYIDFAQQSNAQIIRTIERGEGQ